MINHIESQLREVWVHFVGSKNEEEGVKFSQQPIQVDDESIDNLLKKYFFENFTEPAFFNFDFSTGDMEMNPMFRYAQAIFNDPTTLGNNGKVISKYLYDNSRHPNIKSGDFMVAYVKDVLVEDELVDALCLFKSENKEAFLTLNYSESSYGINQETGINTEKLDKACIIFNTEASEGFKICAVDKSNRAKDAQFWMNDFLNIKQREDDYYHTKNVIQATKHFIKDRMKPLYDIDKTHEADMLNRSQDFLKNEEEFSQGTYEQKVFKDPKVIEEFQLFKDDYKNERNINLADNFSVNLSAVKNQSKVFKSILKLDKNFHVYIHGNRNMIEKGVDDMGRKYYTLYYEEEK